MASWCWRRKSPIYHVRYARKNGFVVYEPRSSAVLCATVATLRAAPPPCDSGAEWSLLAGFPFRETRGGSSRVPSAGRPGSRPRRSVNSRGRSANGTCPCTLVGDGEDGGRCRANRALAPASVAGDAGDKIMVIAAGDKTRTQFSLLGRRPHRALSSRRDARYDLSSSYSRDNENSFRFRATTIPN